MMTLRSCVQFANAYSLTRVTAEEIRAPTTDASPEKKYAGRIYERTVCPPKENDEGRVTYPFG